MKRAFIWTFTALSLGAVPAFAKTFQAVNGVPVMPVTSNSFQVNEDAGQGARGMWCAAADYAKDVLGVTAGTRIYVVDPRQSSRGPVTFGLEPVSQDPSVLPGVVIVGTTLRQAGANLSVSHAQIFCWDRRRTLSR